MLKLTILDGAFAVCRLGRDDDIPAWAQVGGFVSITRTADELSIVCPLGAAPDGVKREGDWRCLKVEGPLDFSLVGILSALATPLAKAGVSIFAVSTYDTDYLMVKETTLEKAIQVLTQAGHQVRKMTGSRP